MAYDDDSDDDGGPNLDGMDPDSLMEFWARHQQGRNAKDLFPRGGKGTKTATADLANYASNKATAMRLRASGDITRARMYEDICDTIYDGLPDFATW